LAKGKHLESACICTLPPTHHPNILAMKDIQELEKMQEDKKRLLRHIEILEEHISRYQNE
jgi:hypothetical protein